MLYSTVSASTEDSGNYSCIAFSGSTELPDYPGDDGIPDVLDYPDGVEKRGTSEEPREMITTRNIIVIVEGTDVGRVEV